MRIKFNEMYSSDRRIKEVNIDSVHARPEA